MDRVGRINMHVFNSINNRLEVFGFARKDSEEFNKLGLTFYQNKSKNIFVKSYELKPTLEDIQIESFNIRETITSQNMNVWESYFIISFDTRSTVSTIENDFNYLLERDNSSIRKYVIQEEEDLNRIPFLDLTKNEVFSFDLKRNLDETKYSTVIDEIIDVIKRQGGLQRKLNEEQINVVVKTIEKDVSK